MNFMFSVFLTGARLNNLIPQHNVITNSGNVHVEISCFVTSNWKLLSLKIRRVLH